MSLEALPGTKIIGGTTIAAGTGGEVKAKEAELYIMDIATSKVEWHDAAIPAHEVPGPGPRPQRTRLLALPAEALLRLRPDHRRLVHRRNMMPELGAPPGARARIFS